MPGARSVSTLLFAGFVAAAASVPAAQPPGQRLEPSDGGFQDRFGKSVAIDGGTAAVGSLEADSDTVDRSGAVYIFERQQGSGVWVEVAKLTPPEPDTSDHFGTSVSLDGDTLAVGADGDDDDGFDTGAVYIYERSQGRKGSRRGDWQLTAKLTPGDGRFDFGCQVDLDGEYLAVATCTVIGDEARAYLFERRPGSPSTWERAWVFRPPDDAGFYGRTVAVSGDTLLVGAALDDDVALQAGAVFVYERDADGPGTWGLTAKLTPDLPAFSGFGSALDLDGDRMLVGAPGFAGAALVLERQAASGQWLEIARLESPDTDQDAAFGTSVALHGERALVGSPGTNIGLFSAGAAYLFERNRGGPNAWGGSRRYVSTDRDPFEDFGSAVALWRGLPLIADPVDDVATTQVGSVHFF